MVAFSMNWPDLPLYGSDATLVPSSYRDPGQRREVQIFMYRRIFLFLILVSLVTVGCRVRSAGEDTDPTPPGESVVGGPPPSVVVPDGSPGPTETLAFVPSITPTATPTVTSTASATNPPSVNLQTDTPTVSVPIITDTPTATSTATVMVMPTNTWTSQPTSTSTASPTITPSGTSTPTGTSTNTAIPSSTYTPAVSSTPSVTLTITPFPPPTQTSLAAAPAEIGGGDSTVVQTATTTPTQPPIAMAQQPTINPNQATATAFFYTQSANMGTVYNITQPGDAGGQFQPGAVTATPTPTATVQYPDCEHYVDPGATLGQIARLYGINSEFLAEYNVLNNTLEYNLQTNPDYLRAGDYLIIPGCGRIPSPTPTIDLTSSSGVGPPSALDNSLGPVSYTVVDGDTVYQLSLTFGVTMAEIVSANPTLAGDVNALTVGQVLTIPKRSQPLTTPTIAAPSS